jgi:peptide/nickel transport system substrate-binding protein
LTGAALGTGAVAAAAVVGCGGEEPGPRDGETRTPGGSPGGAGEDFLGLEPEKPNDGRRVFEPAPPDMRGGTLRYIGFDAVVLDRYDPHQTQFGPMYANLSAVFSKLYMYASHEEPTWENILPDLAAKAPEMVEDPPLTYIIELRRGVKFHDTPRIRQNFPDLAGRELTADDVIYSYERQRNAGSPQRAYYYRASQYETIDRIEKIDDYTIRITTKEPTAPFYHFMADTNAMIIPREIVDEGLDTADVTTGPSPADRMIGTGPFMWDNLVWGIEFNAVRNPQWFGWDDPDLGRPYIDGYKATGQGLNDSTIENLFRQKQIDVAGFIDNPRWIVNIKNEIPDLVFQRQQVSGWIGTRFKTFIEPFNDWRVRRALHLAIDRQQVVDVIGSGVWVKVGPVGGAIKLWALPQEELEALPGYRRGPEREADIQEARQLYEAAGRPPIPQVWFADVPAYIPRFAPTYVETIRRNLGAQIDTITQPYSIIAEQLIKAEPTAAMTWGFDNGWIDLDDWVFPYFRTNGPKNSMRVSDPELDRLLDAQRREFDIERRKQLGYEIQRYILGEIKQDAPGTLARLDYASPGGGSISWPYFKNRTSWPWFGNSYWNANIWFDRNDPSWRGRAN